MGSPLQSTHAFAEAIHPSIFRTRANTWTNLSYVFVGLYVVALAWWDVRRKATEQDPYAVRQPALMALFGVACIVLGFGSGLMHAAMTPFGHKLDVFGMYITLAALIALQWARWVPVVPFVKCRWSTWPFFAIVAVAVSVLLLVHGQKLASGNVIVFSLICLVWLGSGVDTLSRNTSLQFRWLLLAFVSAAIAYFIWRLDRARQFASPDAWMQGHAIWHVLTATSLGAMAYFYRSEAPTRNSTQ